MLPVAGVGSYAIIVKAADAEAARALIDEAEASDASAEGAAEEALSERKDTLQESVEGGVADEA